MRHRIFMVGGRTYDVNDIPEPQPGSQLVIASTIGRFPKKVFINKDHIIAIEPVTEHDHKDTHNLVWQKKNEEYDRTKSKTKFKDRIKKYAQRNNT